MEEILASIRRIISEDAPADGATPPAEAEGHEDVLELTDRVNEEPPPHPVAPPPEEVTPPRYATPLLSHDDGAPPEPPLVSEETALASMASFAAVATEARRRLAREQPLGDGAQTLEAIVRDLLRPMLKEWLDAHLPELVARLVAEEIERLSRRAQ